MGILKVMLPLALLFSAGAAFADEQPEIKYTIMATVGGPYTFGDDSIIPDFEPQDIENTYAIGAELNAWSLTYRRTDAEGDGDGDRVDAQYKNDECPAHHTIGCSVRVRWNGAASETTTLRVSAFNDLPKWHGIETRWALAVDAITGDRQAVVASPELRFTAHPWRPAFSARVTVGGAYSDDTGETEPTWGVELSYAFENSLTLSTGYTSRTVYDFDTGEFDDVERDAVLTLSYAFGPGAS